MLKNATNRMRNIVANNPMAVITGVGLVAAGVGLYTLGFIRGVDATNRVYQKAFLYEHNYMPTQFK